MSEETTEPEPRELQWMLKTCEQYEDDYKDCKRLLARFHQYFVYGEVLDCTQWKKDIANCKRWKSKDDDEAYNALLESEKKRRLQRLGPHYRNTTWTKRDKPPEDFNKPLPAWMMKEYKGTLLDYKQKALESGDVNDLDVRIPLCTIL